MSGRRGDCNGRVYVRAEMLAPYRLLATRVIALAVRDLVTYDRSSESSSAREFLSGSRMLTHWCALAGLDPSVVRAQVGGLVERSRLSRTPAERY